MSRDSDHDLLEEIKYDRNRSNNSTSKGSLISLFENDKSAVFTPSTATGALIAVISTIVIGTLWWASVNTKLENLQDSHNNIVEEVNTYTTEQNTAVLEVKRQVVEIREKLKDMSAETKLYRSRTDRDLLNIDADQSGTSVRVNELMKENNNLDKYIREIEFELTRLQDSMKRLQRKIGEDY